MNINKYEGRCDINVFIFFKGNTFSNKFFNTNYIRDLKLNTTNENRMFKTFSFFSFHLTIHTPWWRFKVFTLKNLKHLMLANSNYKQNHPLKTVFSLYIHTPPNPKWSIYLHMIICQHLKFWFLVLSYKLKKVNNNTLPFPDMLLINNNELEFQVYHKFTKRNSHINFYSHHNTEIKNGIIIGF